ncbi:DUF2604 domain-containing protein [Aurantiacibacter sp. D1-12]|uniref:DUF2604 domain-containing protein n=1 Tax=Aurantiacibacter sp. D1-12 TaxID=2993658 RepID=UPI00237CA0A5|nr:DUF2604 domain-containing protein [Aurantiacibacter sp. D1-12]MDE1468326.1 hypothetical protein [Aurantiacibacter sp. D1-12]
MASENGMTSKRPDDVGQNKPFEIGVKYNGLTKQVETSNAELISALLQKAISTFGITSNQHILSLFDEEGSELKDAETVKQSKVKKKDTLLLRPSAVKAG